MTRRDYKSGAVYRRHSERDGCPPLVDGPPHPVTGKPTKIRPEHKCRALWAASISDGWKANGTRNRYVVTAKTEAAVKRKLRDKRLALDRGETGTSDRTTVKAWAATYLAAQEREVTPKAYNAAASPIRKWIIPTIGQRRLAQLTPPDVRAVHTACRDAGRQAADVHRVLHAMLNAAVEEGHVVPLPALKVKAPKSEKSDRAAMTVDEGLACIEVASKMPNGVRWLFTLLYGQRMGECLGLTWDAVDFEAGAFGEVVIEWQLQALPYNVKRDRTSGFRVPDGYEARHLVDAYHLVRPKSRAGYRVAPLLEPVRDALLAWQAVAPESPHGLVWPESNGRPMNDKHDRAEWRDLQAAAKVAHPAGRPYHVHECRNFAATMLLEADVPEHVITDLLGHSTLATSLRYRTRRREPLLEAMQRVGERLQLG